MKFFENFSDELFSIFRNQLIKTEILSAVIPITFCFQEGFQFFLIQKPMANFCLAIKQNRDKFIIFFFQDRIFINIKNFQLKAKSFLIRFKLFAHFVAEAAIFAKHQRQFHNRLFTVNGNRDCKV
ncbi:hypothetical protein HMPREF3136_08575 [Neisseria sp. HMSC15C08]|nr:hypothetical protein HMPREF3136_08575 [Neisseria sp. HMSC15C08]